MKRIYKLALAAMAGAIGPAGAVIVHAQDVKTTPAYLIVEVDIKDPATFRKYATAIPDTLAPFGGRFIVRGGQTDALEGEVPKRIIVIAFDSIEKARDWWVSPAYAESRPIRHSSAVARTTRHQFGRPACTCHRFSHVPPPASTRSPSPNGLPPAALELDPQLAAPDAVNGDVAEPCAVA